jgi:hypothetical protein
MNIAAEYDVPIRYMERTRDYYERVGFPPYRWPHFTDVPFTPLAKPLRETRLALITTAAPFQPGVGDQGPGARYNAAAKFYQVYSDSIDGELDLRISHLTYDRVHTRAEDPRTWFPLAALRDLVNREQLGALTPRLHGAPTNFSQRVTLEVDGPELLRRCAEDRANAALLVPT